MEQNLPVIAKRFWSIMRLAMLIMRKSVLKKKLMFDLNMMMKRGKIGCKALQNLVMFHHQNRRVSVSGEYEFSCSNTPVNFFHHKRNKAHSNHFFSCAHAPNTSDEDVFSNAVLKALEMFGETAASPALPGFGKSPMVRQVRITDSPFPLSYMEDDNRVDEAAEEFIKRFYNQLKLQNKMSPMLN